MYHANLPTHVPCHTLGPCRPIHALACLEIAPRNINYHATGGQIHAEHSSPSVDWIQTLAVVIGNGALRSARW
jgi:hypothetical protein